MYTFTNLLLADDDADDRFFFKEAIKGFSNQLHLVTVKDGEQLMLYLTEHMDQLPGLLFLDLNMPRKNGFECLREIKNHAVLKNIPVIVYSTSDEREVIKLLYTAGAHFYIQKPDNFSKLKVVVRKAIDLMGKLPDSRPPQQDFILTA